MIGVVKSAVTFLSYVKKDIEIGRGRRGRERVKVESH